MKLKVACIQINPVIGQVEANIAKVRKLLSSVPPVDMVLLPELAITGYNFKSPSMIKPYLESQREGGSSINLAKEISTKFQCFTLIGYPEVYDSTIYNSTTLIAPNGKFLQNYRKTFLYEADEVWGCLENPQKGFKSFPLILDKQYYINPDSCREYNVVQTNIGICMDLNPYKFEAPFNEFEFSLSCFAQKVKLILCPMAWLSPDSPSTKSELTRDEKVAQSKPFAKFFNNENPATINSDPTTKNPVYELTSQDSTNDQQFIPQIPSVSTVNYWILRFFPFLGHKNSIPNKYYKKVHVVACNRVGQEDDVIYGGSSLIIEFNDNGGNHEIDVWNPSVKVLGSMGTGDEGVLVREIDVETELISV
jgi:protein N-terminal amidase